MKSIRKKTILVFIDWFLPGNNAGGPIRSIVNLIQKIDYHYLIVTSNTDHNSEIPYENIPTNTWVDHSENVQVMYLAKEDENSQRIKNILYEEKYDTIYLNGLFSVKYTLRPLWIAQKMGNKKIILAPRGMLKPGAFAIKYRKKKAFLRACSILGLFKNITWHATNEDEKDEIRNHFKNSIVKVAPNLVASHSEKQNSIHKEIGALKLVTVSRVSKEKGILEGVEYLSKTSSSKGKIIWDIYGTLQDESYLNLCNELAQNIDHVNIKFKGTLKHDQVNSTIKSYHFFYLPTLGENFGHAIAESFLASRPVIISNRTPWKNLAELEAGWDLDLSAPSFSKTLDLCIEMNDKSYKSLIAGANKMGENIANDKKTLDLNKKLFQEN